MMLETDRLNLRGLALSDAPTIQALAGHADIAATTLYIPHPYPAEAAVSFIQSVLEGEADSPRGTFGIERKSDGQLVGLIGIRHTPEFDRAELGYWIGVPYWGQGYASEAARRIVDYGFEALGLERVYASFFSHNRASRRVQEKAGMTYEGTLRRHVKRFGVYHDLGYCGILRDEWERGRKV